SLSFLLILLLLTAASPAAAAEKAEKSSGLSDPQELAALKYRLAGPAWRGRRAGRFPHLLRGDGLGRGLEVLGRRLQLAAGLRRPAGLLDRLDRGGALRSERGLRGLGRGEHPRQRGGGQRHLQVHGRRQDLDPRLEAGRADRDPGGPPAQ